MNTSWFTLRLREKKILSQDKRISITGNVMVEWKPAVHNTGQSTISSYLLSHLEFQEDQMALQSPRHHLKRSNTTSEWYQENINIKSS